MTDFKGNTAIVTGSAHGIGLEICKECGRRGMNVVMSDIDMKTLETVSKEVLAAGAPEVLCVYCDVTKLECIEDLVKQAQDKFGTIEMYFSNAGVTALGDIFNIPQRDIEFCMKTDFYSVYYGLKTIIPVMRRQRKPCHIEVTASAASITTCPGMPFYYAAKHAVIGLCEPVYFDLLTWGDDIGMTILCPGMVQTDINTCDDRRPEQFKPDPNDPYYQSMVYKLGRKASDNDISRGQTPEDVVKKLFESIEKKKLYCLPFEDLGDGRAELWLSRRTDVILGKRQYDIAEFSNFVKHDGADKK